MEHDEQRVVNQRARRDVIVAIDAALSDPGRLFRLCAANPHGADALRAAVQAEYGFDEHQADAVLLLQIWRFTPESSAATHAELLEVERWIEQHSGR